MRDAQPLPAPASSTQGPHSPLRLGSDLAPSGPAPLPGAVASPDDDKAAAVEAAAAARLSELEAAQQRKATVTAVAGAVPGGGDRTSPRSALVAAGQLSDQERSSVGSSVDRSSAGSSASQADVEAVRPSLGAVRTLEPVPEISPA